MRSEGGVQYGLGFLCLWCGNYFQEEITDAQWTHPDLKNQIYPVACPNNGKIFQVPILKEVKIQ